MGITEYANICKTKYTNRESVIGEDRVWREILEGKRRGASAIDCTNNTLFNRCLMIRQEFVGKMRLHLYEETDKGKQEIIYNKKNERYRDVLRVIKVKPNPIQQVNEFNSALERDRILYGNSFAFIERREKREKGYTVAFPIQNIWHLSAKHVKIRYIGSPIMNNGYWYYIYTDPYSGKQYSIDKEYIAHFKLVSDGNLISPSIYDLLKTTITDANEAERFEGELIRNGLTAKLLLQYDPSLSTDSIKMIQEKMAEVGVNGLISKTRGFGYLPAGMNPVPINPSLVDSQFIELKKFKKLDIASMMGVTPTMINDYQNSKYATSEAEQNSFLQNTGMFTVKTYEDGLEDKIFTEQERLEGKTLEFNVDATLRLDAKTKSEIVNSLRTNGIYATNEARKLYNLYKIDSKVCDIPCVNGTYIPVTELGKQYGIDMKEREEEKRDGEND